MESDSCDAPLEAKKDAGRNTPAGLVITSYRAYTADVDNISPKAIIDGLVHAGILEDDGPRFVKEVTLRFKKVKNHSEEKTVVDITWN